MLQLLFGRKCKFFIYRSKFVYVVVTFSPYEHLIIFHMIFMHYDYIYVKRTLFRLSLFYYDIFVWQTVWISGEQRLASVCSVGLQIAKFPPGALPGCGRRFPPGLSSPRPGTEDVPQSGARGRSWRHTWIPLFKDYKCWSKECIGIDLLER